MHRQKRMVKNDDGFKRQSYANDKENGASYKAEPFSSSVMRPNSAPTFRTPAAISNENTTTGSADAAPNTDESNNGELLSMTSGMSEPK